MGAGMVGREEGGGEGDRSSEGARGRSTKLGHWSFIHITRPFMRFANRSAFMLSTHFFVFFEKTFFFSLSLSLVSNSEKTVSPIHAHLPRQPPARLSLLFTFKVNETKSRDHETNLDEDFFLPFLRYRNSHSCSNSTARFLFYFRKLYQLLC